MSFTQKSIPTIILVILVFIAVPLSADEDILESAKRAVRMKEYQKAAGLFNSIADEGNIEAQYQLGVLYEIGKGVGKDDIKAFYWYTKAAENGYDQAQYNLGTMYKNGWAAQKPDYEKARYWYQQAANQGHRQAEERLQNIDAPALSDRRNTKLSKDSLLMEAAGRGDIDEMRQLIAEGGDINFQDEYGRTPLIEAVLRHRAQAAVWLVQQGAGLEAANADGDNVLLIVAEKGDSDVVKTIVDAGADINITNRWGFTPLMLAVQRNDPAMVQLFLEHNADVGKINNFQQDALQLALAKGYEDIAKLLTATGKVVQPVRQTNSAALDAVIKKLQESSQVSEDGASEKGWTPLMLAAWRGEGDIVKLILQQGTDVDTVDQDGLTALGRAAWKGYGDIVELLLTAGAKPEMEPPQAKPVPYSASRPYFRVAASQQLSAAVFEGLCPSANIAPKQKTFAHSFTGKACGLLRRRIKQDLNASPLVLAAENGHEMVVRRLLKNYVPSEAHASVFQEAIARAIIKGHGTVVKALMEAGVSLTIKEHGELSSLFLMAAAKGDKDLMEIFLKHGADRNARGPSEKTALMLAVEMGHKEVVQYLLDKKVELRLRDQQGNTALASACLTGNADIVTLLLDAGSDVDTQNAAGNTPLMMAADARQDTVVGLLLDRGADVNILNASGHSALSIAIKHNNALTAKRLLDNGANPHQPLKIFDNMAPEMMALLKRYWSFKSWLREIF